MHKSKKIKRHKKKSSDNSLYIIMFAVIIIIAIIGVYKLARNTYRTSFIDISHADQSMHNTNSDSLQ
jgi:hypothetical protein